MSATPVHAQGTNESLLGRRYLADRVRYVADVFALWADGCNRLAERIAPSIKPSSDYAEFINALRREALAEHNAQVTRSLYCGQTIRQRNGLRMVGK